jgi:hypothetical protein
MMVDESAADLAEVKGCHVGVYSVGHHVVDVV